MPHSATAQDAPAELTRREVRSGLLQGFWTLVEDASDAATVQTVMAEAGVPEYMARDAQGWLSYQYYARLNAAVAKHLYGLDAVPGMDHELWQLWRQTPVHAMEQMGFVLTMFRAFGSTESMYKAIASMTAMGNVGIQVEHFGLGPGLARFEMRPKSDPAAVGPATVWKVYGWLERMQTIWGLPPAEVRLEHRVEDGAPVYSYRVQYQHGSADRRLVIGYGALGAATGLSIGKVLGQSLVMSPLLGMALVLAVVGWARLIRRARQAESDGARLRDLIEQLDERYTSERRALLTTQRLSGYLASELVEEILDNPDAEVLLGGQSAHAAVLFSDIVAFTPRCEQRSAELIVQELNTYFSHVDPVFSKHGGVIDKRIGDGIMVVFASRGARSRGEVCHAALSAALQCLTAVESVNREFATNHAPPISIRLGVSYGPLIQGNMGSEERLEYTVIGDTVNLAARLESSATPGTVLVDSGVFEGAKAHATVAGTVESRRQIRVKGKAAHVDVVELSPIGSA